MNEAIQMLRGRHNALFVSPEPSIAVAGYGGVEPIPESPRQDSQYRCGTPRPSELIGDKQDAVTLRVDAGGIRQVVANHIKGGRKGSRACEPLEDGFTCVAL